jgi:hypothetical protein
LAGGNRKRTVKSKAKGKLTWGSDRGLRAGERPTALKIRLSPGGGFYFASRAGPAAGARFMEGSVDAALD